MYAVFLWASVGTFLATLNWLIAWWWGESAWKTIFASSMIAPGGDGGLSGSHESDILHVAMDALSMSKNASTSSTRALMK